MIFILNTWKLRLTKFTTSWSQLPTHTANPHSVAPSARHTASLGLQASPPILHPDPGWMGAWPQWLSPWRCSPAWMLYVHHTVCSPYWWLRIQTEDRKNVLGISLLPLSAIPGCLLCCWREVVPLLESSACQCASFLCFHFNNFPKGWALGAFMAQEFLVDEKLWCVPEQYLIPVTQGKSAV